MSMGDDWEWDPTFKTPDGRVLDVDGGGGRELEPHRDPEVLREMYEGSDMTVIEMAEELGVSDGTLTTQLKKSGIGGRGNMPGEPDYSAAMAMGARARWDDSFDPPELDDEPKPEYRCPDCGMPHWTRYWQQACMMAHARTAADKLGGEVL